MIDGFLNSIQLGTHVPQFAFDVLPFGGFLLPLHALRDHCELGCVGKGLWCLRQDEGLEGRYQTPQKLTEDVSFRLL